MGLTLALAGHTMGGGHMSPAPVTFTVLGVVMAVVWSLGGRRLTLGQIIGLLLIAQIAVHLGCVVGSTMAPLGAAMILGHIVATGLTAVVLARGEQFLWALAERLGLRVVPLLATPPALMVRGATRRFASHDDPRPPAFVFAGGTGLRGPPVGVV